MVAEDVAPEWWKYQDMRQSVHNSICNGNALLFPDFILLGGIHKLNGNFHQQTLELKMQAWLWLRQQRAKHSRPMNGHQLNSNQQTKLKHSLTVMGMGQTVCDMMYNILPESQTRQHVLIVVAPLICTVFSICFVTFSFLRLSLFFFEVCEVVCFWFFSHSLFS